MLCITEEKLACSLTRLLDDNLYQLKPDDEGWVNFDDLYYKFEHRPALGWIFRIAALSRQHQEARFDVLQKNGAWCIRAHRVDDATALLMFLRAAHNWLSSQSSVPTTGNLQHFSKYWRYYPPCKRAFSEDITRTDCLQYIQDLIESLAESLPSLQKKTSSTNR